MMALTLKRHYGPGLERRVLEDGQLSPTIFVLISDRDARHLKSPDTPLKSDDSIGVFPIVAGGQSRR
jgi:molybdopterin converting factor small subunit